MTLRERLFELPSPADVEAFLAQYPLAVIFKASTTDKTFEGWAHVEKALETRPDVAVGLIRIPQHRHASNHVEAKSGIQHQSPQLLLFVEGSAKGALDNFKINPDNLPGLLHHLPTELGPAVRNPDLAEFKPYRKLLEQFTQGDIREETFQWRYLELLAAEAEWRNDGEFELLNSLFPNPAGRSFKPATVVAQEFQNQLAGKAAPLLERAKGLLDTLHARC